MNDDLTPVSVVAALPAAYDRQSLADIFAHTRWNLRFSSNLCDTQQLISTSRPGVVITDRRLPDGHWQDVLDEIDRQPSRPSLIVACVTDDVHLWAEVLNLGAQDVLVKPFRETEVLRSISSAWRWWSQRHRRLGHHSQAIAL